MKKTEAYTRLVERGIRPSVQRIAIMDFLLKHPIHPNIEDVYNALENKVPTLSRTTVYNSLRLLSEQNAAQMITIDEHHVCYDGNIEPHVHFYCKKCGKITDLFEEPAPEKPENLLINGNIVQEKQLYYKGICSACAKKMEKKKN